MKEEVFSAREKLVIQRVKEGRTNKEIAQELNVAEITIKNS
ncbi:MULTISPECIES: LuxR C-terminal-related transcriptional regulator [Acidaminococcus]|nr:LuxR C-terminal-related transcriptional regulator [Acidaminococcus massiliensis]